MLEVDDAVALVVAGFAPLPAEVAGLETALSRVLAEDVRARLTQPPAAVSAMDGYAVRAADTAPTPRRLRIVGRSAAGAGFEGTIGAGEAVRIFTGAPLPEGADAVVIQEDTTADGESVTPGAAAEPGRFVRPAGLDFGEGEVVLAAGRRLTPRDVALAAAANVPWLKVRRRPRVAIVATGDELAMPGEPLRPGRIVNSNGLLCAGQVRTFGAIPVDLGIAADDEEALVAAVTAARGCDLLVTLGGASVGDHDLVRPTLAKLGFDLALYKVAMRPGKPIMFGRLGDLPVIGLPGNPVSVGVGGAVFLRPVVHRLSGVEPVSRIFPARLGRDLAANDARQDYLRARLVRDPDGTLVARPFDRQDSAMLRLFAEADGLVVRPPHAPAARAGDRVPVLPLADS
jgi:molybdopterin molybdotransferase